MAEGVAHVDGEQDFFDTQAYGIIVVRGVLAHRRLLAQASALGIEIRHCGQRQAKSENGSNVQSVHRNLHRFAAHGARRLRASIIHCARLSSPRSYHRLRADPQAARHILSRSLLQ